MTQMTYTETLEVTHCWCGIAVAVPSSLLRHARNDSRNDIYCPLGHTFVFRDDYRTKYQAEQKRRQAALDLLAAEERSHSATRGHLTRTKKRISNGVCPCCKRHFVNVERHMKNKHPDYTE